MGSNSHECAGAPVPEATNGAPDVAASFDQQTEAQPMELDATYVNGGGIQAKVVGDRIYHLISGAEGESWRIGPLAGKE